MMHRSLVAVRLSADARRLEILLDAAALSVPVETVMTQLLAECERLGVAELPTEGMLLSCLGSWKPGVWQTLLEAEGPGVSLDARVEVLVPVPATTELGRARSASFVREGTPLARLLPESVGTPGRDLLGRTIPARPPRPARLPQGEYTRIGDNGTVLLAACDGVIALRQLRIHLQPTALHEGDVTEADSVLRCPTDLLIRGSVHSARIEVSGSVRIDGSVYDSHIVCTGDVSVAGAVIGSSQQPCTIQAGGDLLCDRCTYTTLSTGGDLYLSGEARRSTLQVEGHLHLAQSIDRVLLHVRLHLKGGLILPTPGVRMHTVPTERQYFRVPANITAELALHQAPLSAFRKCIVADISAGGVRCRLVDSRHEPLPPLHSVVQLKVPLPGYTDRIVTIGRVTREIGREIIAIGFEQITDRDRERLLEFCKQVQRGRPDLTASPADRRPEVE